MIGPLQVRREQLCVRLLVDQNVWLLPDGDQVSDPRWQMLVASDDEIPACTESTMEFSKNRLLDRIRKVSEGQAAAQDHIKRSVRYTLSDIALLEPDAGSKLVSQTVLTGDLIERLKSDVVGHVFEGACRVAAVPRPPEHFGLTVDRKDAHRA